MCLALPMKIKKIEADGFAVAESQGLSRRVNIQMLKDPRPGEYVLVHAGFAIEKIDARKAKETLRIFDEIRG